MASFFVWSPETNTHLTVVQSEDASTALETATSAVAKLVFQNNLKNEKPVWFEVSTATVQGTATTGFPEANDSIALEIK